MANFREHVIVSGLLGVGYGGGAVWGFGFDPMQATLAGGLATLGGMLPDLDLDTGVPIRELFGLTGALAPLLLLNRLAGWGGSLEATILMAAGVYLLVRFGAAWVLSRVTVHRGMFHSIPAALIAAEIVFLCYSHSDPWPRLLLAGGVLVGFTSHLLLDEIYSVQVRGVSVRLNKAAGSALKLFSSSAAATFFAYALLLGLTYTICREQGVIDAVPWAEELTSVVSRPQ